MFESEESGDAALSGADAQRLAAVLAGPPSAARLALIARLDPTALSAAQRIDLLTALDRHHGWLAALQQRTLAEIEATDDTPDGRAQEAVMCALRLPARAAQTRLKAARTLRYDLPATLGQSHAAPARTIATTIHRVDPVTAERRSSPPSHPPHPNNHRSEHWG